MLGTRLMSKVGSPLNVSEGPELGALENSFDGTIDGNNEGSPNGLAEGEKVSDGN